MIVIPPEHRNLPEKTESTASLHPEVKKLLRSLQDVLGSTYSYRYTEKSDKELFAEALKAREK